MSNSPLATKQIISPNYNDRTEKICKITPHHAAGKLKAESLAKIFSRKSRQASANYVIGYDGEIILVVPEDKRAWTSGSPWNDQRAVTIEVSNDGGASTNWHVSDAAFNALVNLCADICKRNGMNKLEFTGDKNGSLTMHKMFKPTACPGPYLESKFPELAEKVNAILNPEPVTPPATPAAPSAPAKLNAEQLADAIYAGKYGNEPERSKKLKAEGYTDAEIKAAQGVVNARYKQPSAPAKLNAEQLADAIYAGKYGNEPERSKKLKAEGYTDAEIKAAQGVVNARYKQPSAPAPSSTEIKEGDLVKIKSTAQKWATGAKIPGWVKTKTLYVRSTPANGKVNVSTLRSGDITGVAYLTDLVKV